MSIIQLKNITKIYGQDEAQTTALNNLNLNINEGDFLAIMGPSGSGKSSLLNIIGCMDIPTSGEYYLDGMLVNTLSNNYLSKIRNEHIGFIFQNFELMKEYTIYENVELPLTYRKISKKDKKELVMYYLKELGIENQANKKPSQLSGGQQQRVAIARALVSNAKIILADEPTGSLDQKTGSELMILLSRINNNGKTVIVITHDDKVASYCKRKITITDGMIIEDINS